MCIGVPMQVIENRPGFFSLCADVSGRRALVNVALVGQPALGAWLLVFLGSAREILSEDEAGKVARALEAVELALQGETDLDHLFADLVGREPELPAFLQEADNGAARPGMDNAEVGGQDAEKS